jgi:hypothetical protein
MGWQLECGLSSIIIGLCSDGSVPTALSLLSPSPLSFGILVFEACHQVIDRGIQAPLIVKRLCVSAINFLYKMSGNVMICQV